MADTTSQAISEQTDRASSGDRGFVRAIGLFDGTMIVVEDGARSIDQEVDVVVTRVLQTVAGRMIFAALKGQNVRSSYNFGRGR